ncbi:hypothetical protein CMT22_17850 [Elizabethkingia anophelis]|nr:hypothetical protein [Elizabethkingia anophelis]
MFLNWYLSFAILSSLYYLYRVFTKKRFSAIFDLPNGQIISFENKYKSFNVVSMLIVSVVLFSIIVWAFYNLMIMGYFSIYGF